MDPEVENCVVLPHGKQKNQTNMKTQTKVEKLNIDNLLST